MSEPTQTPAEALRAVLRWWAAQVDVDRAMYQADVRYYRGRVYVSGNGWWPTETTDPT